MSGQDDPQTPRGADNALAPLIPGTGPPLSSGNPPSPTGSDDGNPHAPDAAAAAAKVSTKDDDPPPLAGMSSSDASGAVTLNPNAAIGVRGRTDPGLISGTSTSTNSQLTPSQLNAREIALIKIQNQDMSGQMNDMMSLLRQLLAAQQPPSTTPSESSDKPGLSQDDLSLTPAKASAQIAQGNSLAITGASSQADADTASDAGPAPKVATIRVVPVDTVRVGKFST